MVLTSNNDVSQINASIQSLSNDGCTKLKNTIYNTSAVTSAIQLTQNAICDFFVNTQKEIDHYTTDYVDAKLRPLNMTPISGIINSVCQTNGLVSATCLNEPTVVPFPYTPQNTRGYLGWTCNTCVINLRDPIPPKSVFSIGILIGGLTFHSTSQYLLFAPINNGFGNVSMMPSLTYISEWTKYFECGVFCCCCTGACSGVTIIYDCVCAYGTHEHWHDGCRDLGITLTGYSGENSIDQLYAHYNLSNSSYQIYEHVSFDVSTGYETIIEE